MLERRGLIDDLSAAVSFRWDVFPQQGLNIYHVHPKIQMGGLRDGWLDSGRNARMEGWIDEWMTEWMMVKSWVAEKEGKWIDWW